MSGMQGQRSERRIGSEESATRAALLDAAQALMLEGGHATVTSRRVAAQAGVKSQLVHYYFRTMDDLFLALFRRGAEANLVRQAEALASPRPLHALWHFSCEPAGTQLTVEFAALANHRREMRSEIAEFAAHFRQRQVDALGPLLAGSNLAPDETSALVVLVLGTAISRILAMEDALGLALGHAATYAWVERLLDEIEPPEG